MVGCVMESGAWGKLVDAPMAIDLLFHRCADASHMSHVGAGEMGSDDL
jgi:hypothetical protein